MENYQNQDLEKIYSLFNTLKPIRFQRESDESTRIALARTCQQILQQLSLSSCQRCFRGWLHNVGQILYCQQLPIKKRLDFLKEQKCF